jgi:hypothetical protein
MLQRKRRRDEQAILEELGAVLYDIDAGCGYGDWIRVLMAIKYETQGSEEGFKLADAWSSGGSNYKGIRSPWRLLPRAIRN